MNPFSRCGRRPLLLPRFGGIEKVPTYLNRELTERKHEIIPLDRVIFLSLCFGFDRHWRINMPDAFFIRQSWKQCTCSWGFSRPMGVRTGAFFRESELVKEGIGISSTRKL
ncbi:uncharacterized protein LOC110914821 isoform X1 [Helianthus annuus]|uniref:uncharacterized protein LOC110914821 isoform X1 n=1 Tax=Helianthus annuus TaxID=4232 RepID=UPI001652B802|nr:uncharacterized protein LOC110914821 isoform X1 [Helianthus annuus]